MHKTFLSSVMFLCLISAVYAAEQGLNPTGNAWVKAVKANDIEGVMALYADDAVLFPPDSFEARGKEAIRKVWGGMMEAYTVQDVTISNAFHEIHGDLSSAWGHYSLTLVPKAGGEPVVMKGRFSDVSKKINGKWLYIADHASAPLAPPTQTAP